MSALNKAIKVIATAIALVTIPIMLLNRLGGVVAVIWLCFLGEWLLVLSGVLFLFTAPLYYGILMLPADFVLTPLAMSLHERNRPLACLLVLLSAFYTNLLIVGSCAFAFLFCEAFYAGGSKLGLIPDLLWSWTLVLCPWQLFTLICEGFYAGGSKLGLIPYLLWSWNLALCPWQFLSEPDNEFATITLFTATLFYLLFLLSVFLPVVVTTVIFAAFLLVQLLLVPIGNMLIASRMKGSTSMLDS